MKYVCTVCGHIYDETGTIDEVLVMLMRGPRTFTAEDTVEINCHGGVYVMKRVLHALLRNGAVMAQPGEFSKRAFLNGKLSLSSAEGLIDMINSESEGEVKAGYSLYREKLKKEIEKASEQRKAKLIKLLKNKKTHTAFCPQALNE